MRRVEIILNIEEFREGCAIVDESTAERIEITGTRGQVDEELLNLERYSPDPHVSLTATAKRRELKGS